MQSRFFNKISEDIYWTCPMLYILRSFIGNWLSVQNTEDKRCNCRYSDVAQDEKEQRAYVQWLQVMKKWQLVIQSFFFQVLTKVTEERPAQGLVL